MSSCTVYSTPHHSHMAPRVLPRCASLIALDDGRNHIILHPVRAIFPDQRRPKMSKTSSYQLHWLCWLGKIWTENPFFISKLFFSSQCSLHPILRQLQPTESIQKIAASLALQGDMPCRLWGKGVCVLLCLSDAVEICIYIYITITVYLWNICCSHTKNLEESSNEAVLDSCPGNWLVISSIRTCSDMIYIYLYLFRPSQRKCSHTFSYWILITHQYAQKRTASTQGVAEWLVVQLSAKY